MRSFALRYTLILAAAVAVGACDDNDDDTPTGGTPPPVTTPSPNPTPTPTPAATPTPVPTPSPGSGGTETFAGRLDIMDSNSVVVNDVSYFTDEGTEYFRGPDRISRADLTVGDFVVVKARRRSDGTWLAREIKVRRDM